MWRVMLVLVLPATAARSIIQPLPQTRRQTSFDDCIEVDLLQVEELRNILLHDTNSEYTTKNETSFGLLNEDWQRLLLLQKRLPENSLLKTKLVRTFRLLLAALHQVHFDPSGGSQTSFENIPSFRGAETDNGLEEDKLTAQSGYSESKLPFPVSENNKTENGSQILKNVTAKHSNVMNNTNNESTSEFSEEHKNSIITKVTTTFHPVRSDISEITEIDDITKPTIESTTSDGFQLKDGNDVNKFSTKTDWNYTESTRDQQGAEATSRDFSKVSPAGDIPNFSNDEMDVTTKSDWDYIRSTLDQKGFETTMNDFGKVSLSSDIPNFSNDEMDVTTKTDWDYIRSTLDQKGTETTTTDFSKVSPTDDIPNFNNDEMNLVTKSNWHFTGSTRDQNAAEATTENPASDIPNVSNHEMDVTAEIIIPITTTKYSSFDSGSSYLPISTNPLIDGQKYYNENITITPSSTENQRVSSTDDKQMPESNIFTTSEDNLISTTVVFNSFDTPRTNSLNIISTTQFTASKDVMSGSKDVNSLTDHTASDYVFTDETDDGLKTTTDGIFYQSAELTDFNFPELKNLPDEEVTMKTTTLNSEIRDPTINNNFSLKVDNKELPESKNIYYDDTTIKPTESVTNELTTALRDFNTSTNHIVDDSRKLKENTTITLTTESFKTFTMVFDNERENGIPLIQVGRIRILPARIYPFRPMQSVIKNNCKSSTNCANVENIEYVGIVKRNKSESINEVGHGLLTKAMEQDPQDWLYKISNLRKKSVNT